MHPTEIVIPETLKLTRISGARVNHTFWLGANIDSKSNCMPEDEIGERYDLGWALGRLIFQAALST